MSNPPDDAVPFLNRLALFQERLLLQCSQVIRNLIAGLTLAAMNIPQLLAYVGTPVITGFYTLLLPVVAFSIFWSLVLSRSDRFC